MTRDETLKIVRRVSNRGGFPPGVQKAVESLMLFMIQDHREAHSMRKAKVAMENSLKCYSLWHRPEHQPNRKENLLIKLKVAKEGGGARPNQYYKARYEDGKFYVGDEAVEIDGWVYLAECFEK